MNGKNTNKKTTSIFILTENVGNEARSTTSNRETF